MAVAKAAVNKFRMEKVRSHITIASHKKRGESMKGHFVSEVTKDKIRQKALGRIVSEATKEKIRKTLTGRKVSAKVKANLLFWATGENSFNWKGDDVGYRALHRWIEGQLGQPTTCEDCGKTDLTGHFIHWANLSGEYKRDVTDWKRLCALCHKRYDKEQ